MDSGFHSKAQDSKSQEFGLQKPNLPGFQSPDSKGRQFRYTSNVHLTRFEALGKLEST